MRSDQLMGSFNIAGILPVFGERKFFFLRKNRELSDLIQIA